MSSLSLPRTHLKPLALATLLGLAALGGCGGTAGAPAAGASAMPEAGANAAPPPRPASESAYRAFIEAVREFSGEATVELPGAEPVSLAERVVAGFEQDPVRRLELDDGTTVYWGWQHRQAFIRSAAVFDADGQPRMVAAANNLPRIMNLRADRAIASEQEYEAYLAEQIEQGQEPSLVVVAPDQATLDRHYPLLRRWVQASALGLNTDCSDPAQAPSCAFVEKLEVPLQAFKADCDSGRVNDCPLQVPGAAAADVPLDAFRQ